MVSVMLVDMVISGVKNGQWFVLLLLDFVQ